GLVRGTQRTHEEARLETTHVLDLQRTGVAVCADPGAGTRHGIVEAAVVHEGRDALTAAVCTQHFEGVGRRVQRALRLHETHGLTAPRGTCKIVVGHRAGEVFSVAQRDLQATVLAHAHIVARLLHRGGEGDQISRCRSNLDRHSTRYHECPAIAHIGDALWHGTRNKPHVDGRA